jgi:hypothetical protein
MALADEWNAGHERQQDTAEYKQQGLFEYLNTATRPCAITSVPWRMESMPVKGAEEVRLCRLAIGHRKQAYVWFELLEDGLLHRFARENEIMGGRLPSS